MSIESDLGRIAVALEKIAARYVPADVQIGVAPADDGPGSEIGPVNTKTPRTPEALKKLAIEIAQKLTPEEGKNFTAYVRGFVCARFGVQKLMEVPANEVEYAIGLLNEFDKKVDYSSKKGN